MPRFPGGILGRGGGLIGLIIQTPWIAYVFLILLLYCLLSAFIEKRKIIGYVQITVAICIPVVAVFRNAQGHGWEYAMIWVFGLIGCLMYWIDRQIQKTPRSSLYR